MRLARGGEGVVQLAPLEAVVEAKALLVRGRVRGGVGVGVRG